MVDLPSHIGLFKGIVVVFLVFLNILVGLYVTANLVDSHMIPILNPPDQTYSFTVPLIYPSPVGSEMMFGPDTVALNVTVTYTGVLAERQPVTIEAYGTIGQALASQVEYVTIGFEGALPYSNSTQIGTSNPAFNGVTMSISSNDTTSISYYLGNTVVPAQNVITFPTQGDYYPTLELDWYPALELASNMTLRPLLYGFQDFKIHVSSSEVTTQIRTDRINTALTIAIFSFSAIESVAIIFRFMPKKWLGENEGDPDQYTPQTPQTKTAQEKAEKKREPPWRYKKHSKQT